MSQIPLQLSPLEQTLLLPVWGRAAFTQLFSGFQDPKALQVLNRLAFDFSKVQRAIGAFGWIAWGYRAFRIDNVCRDFLQRHPSGVIVNLGAGLDTIFERIDNGKLFCLSVDLDQTISLRRKLFPESTRNVYIASSIGDSRWVQNVPERGPILIVMSGVTMYLAESEMKNLFAQLADLARSRDVELVCDAFSPAAISLTNWSIKRSQLPDVPVKFGSWRARHLRRWVPNLIILTDDLLIRGILRLGLLRHIPLTTMFQLLVCWMTGFSRIYHVAFARGSGQ